MTTIALRTNTRKTQLSFREDCSICMKFDCCVVKKVDEYEMCKYKSKWTSCSPDLEIRCFFLQRLQGNIRVSSSYFYVSIALASSLHSASLQLTHEFTRSPVLPKWYRVSRRTRSEYDATHNLQIAFNELQALASPSSSIIISTAIRRAVIQSTDPIQERGEQCSLLATIGADKLQEEEEPELANRFHEPQPRAFPSLALPNLVHRTRFNSTNSIHC